MSDDANKPTDVPVPGLPQGLQIRVDDDVAQGMYSNFQIVGSNETEFILDFAYIQPNQLRGKVRARLILSPKHAKGLLRSLSERVRDHEARFGPIVLPTGMPTGGSGLIN